MAFDAFVAEAVSTEIEKTNRAGAAVNKYIS